MQFKKCRDNIPLTKIFFVYFCILFFFNPNLIYAKTNPDKSNTNIAITTQTDNDALLNDYNEFKSSLLYKSEEEDLETLLNLIIEKKYDDSIAAKEFYQIISLLRSMQNIITSSYNPEDFTKYKIINKTQSLAKYLYNAYDRSFYGIIQTMSLLDPSQSQTKTTSDQPDTDTKNLLACIQIKTAHYDQINYIKANALALFAASFITIFEDDDESHQEHIISFSLKNEINNILENQISLNTISDLKNITDNIILAILKLLLFSDTYLESHNIKASIENDSFLAKIQNKATSYYGYIRSFIQNDEEKKLSPEEQIALELKKKMGSLLDFKPLRQKNRSYCHNFTLKAEDDEKIIHYLNGQSIPLTNMIESFFSEDSLIDLAKNSFAPKEYNKIRSELAAKWKKNASTCIFHDKKRSLLEAVINSADSYSKENSVGKFGMGFFSMLSLLRHEETDGAFIVIETCYLTQNKNLFAYKITLQLNDGEITTHFEQLPNNIFGGKTGTKISVTPKNPEKTFSENTLYSLLYYMHLLDFYEKAYIDLYFQPTPKHKITREQIGESYQKNRYVVTCNILPTVLSTEDFGTGIPIDTALTKLLVPSSTNKEVSSEKIMEMREQILSKEAPAARFVNYKGKKEKTSHALIGINDVIVLTIDTENENLGDKDILISMPQLTKLTLARNEISFSYKDSFEEKYIKKVISKTLRDTLLKKNEDNSILGVLYEGLKKWEEKSMADIKGRFTGYFKEELKRILNENNLIIPVSLKHHENFRCILEDNKDVTLVPLDNDLVDYNYITLENLLYSHINNSIQKERGKDILQRALDGELFPNFHTSFIEDKCFGKETSTITPFNLKRHLFVPKSIFSNIHNLSYSKPEEELAKQIIDLSTEYDLTQNPEENTDFHIAFTNLPKLKEDSCIAWKWVKKTKGKAFLKAKNSHPLFTKKDKELLKNFFTKHQDIILNKNLLGFIYPGKNDIFVGDDATNFSHSKTFKRYVLEKLFHDDSVIYSNIKEVWYFFYNKEKKHFFISSWELDSPYEKDGYEKSGDKLFKTSLSKKATNLITENSLHAEGHKRCLSSSETCWESLEEAMPHLINNIEQSGEMETYDNAIEKIRNHLTSSGKILELHDFMNNFFNALLLPFNDNKEIREEDQQKIIIINGEQIWPLEGKLSLEKLESLFFTLLSQLFPRKASKVIAANGKTKPILLHFPNLNKSELIDLEKWLRNNFLGWLVSRKNTLEAALPNLNIYSSIANLFQWLKSNESKNELNKETVLLIKQFQETTFGLYNKYFNIPESSFHRDYGDGNLNIKTINPENDMENTGNVHKLINYLQLYPNLLKKLLYFQVIDFKFQTDTSLRDKDLEDKTFYNPSILSNTPISILSLLLEKNVAYEIIRVIIKEVQTPEELMIISYSILTNDFYKHCQFDNKDAIDPHELSLSIRLIIKHALRKKIGTNRLFDLYSKNRVKSSAPERIERVGKESLIKTIIGFLKSLRSQKNPTEKRDQLSSLKFDKKIKPLSFRLTQLIKAYMQGKGILLDPRNHNLNATTAKIRKQKPKLNLGKITQSIEYNDERNPLHIPITETVQNSADAITDFMMKIANKTSSIQPSILLRKKQGPEDAIENLTKIKYAIEWMDDIDNKIGHTHTCLTARDFIGFPNLKTLMSDFMLPDYNNKGEKDIGEMGNGSLKMYKDAKKVLIMTRTLDDPNKVYLLDITPVVDPLTKETQDLNITCLDISKEAPKNFFGTSIRILFNSKKAKETKMDLLLMVNFFRSSLISLKVGLPQKKTMSVYLNEKLLNDEKDSEIFLEKINKITGKYDFRIRKLKDEFIPSQVTTGGIPFSDMIPFLEELNLLPSSLIDIISMGFILDISKDLYEPVVSRNHLQMKPEKLKELKKLLLDACYIQGLKLGEKNRHFLMNNLLHFGSRSGLLYQITLSKKDNKNIRKMIDRFLNLDEKIDMKKCDFFTYYKPSSLDYSFFDIIEDGYKNLVPKLMTKKRELQKESDKKLQELEEKSLKEISKIEDEEEKYKKVEEFKTEHKKLYKKHLLQLNTYCQNTLKEWGKTQPKDHYNLAKIAAAPWFKNKINNIEIKTRKPNKDKKRDLLSKKEKEELEKIKEEWSEKFDNLESQVASIKDLLNNMLTLYGKLSVDKAEINENALSYINIYYNKRSEASAFYNGNEIYINLSSNPIKDFLKIAKALVDKNNKKPLSKIDVIKKHFIPKLGYTPTLIHELEHVRRREQSQDSAHNKCILPNGKKSAFNICANEFARKALSNYLLKDWKEQMLKIKTFPHILEDMIDFINEEEDEEYREEKEKFLLKKIGVIE